VKVLLAVHNFPPEFIGGVERTVELLASDLVGVGDEVAIFAGSARRAAATHVEREVYGAIPIHRLVRRVAFQNPADEFDPAADDAFERLLGDFSPDVVHVHHWHNLGAAMVSLAARRGIPSVVTLHDYWTTCSLFFRMPGNDAAFCREPERVEACHPCIMRHQSTDADELTHGLEMRFGTIAQELDLAAAILVSGRATAETLELFGRGRAARRSRMHIVPLGAAAFEPIARRPSPSDRLVIAHWGNLSAVKGVLGLARAAARSAAAPRIDLRLYGACCDEGFADELRAAAGTVRLELHGRYDVSRLPELLAEADAAVFPSLARETHSIVLDEALALGLPLIVSDRGELPERAGPGAIVVPAGDDAALAAAIDRLADPEVRERMRRQRVAPVISSAEHAQAVRAVYRRVLEAPPRFPSFIADWNRARLTFRRSRLEEIHRYVLDLERRCAELAARGASGPPENPS
jgi:glycosyltransferase involved in cell wall biosynthesis